MTEQPLTMKQARFFAEREVEIAEGLVRYRRMHHAACADDAEVRIHAAKLWALMERLQVAEDTAQEVFYAIEGDLDEVQLDMMCELYSIREAILWLIADAVGTPLAKNPWDGMLLDVSRGGNWIGADEFAALSESA